MKEKRIRFGMMVMAVLAVSVLLASCLNPRVPSSNMSGATMANGAGQETVMHEPKDSVLTGEGWDTVVEWETDFPMTTGNEGDPALDTIETASSVDLPQTTPTDPAGDSLDFWGQDVVFLAPISDEDVYDHFLPIRDSEDTVEAAFYKRKAVVEERLNVALQVKYVKDAPTVLHDHVLARDNSYSVALLPENTLHTFLSEGYMTDLLKLPYLDLWGDGFDVTSAKAYQANGAMLAVAGDVTLSRAKETQAFFYNATQVDGERMVELVANGEWTLEQYLIMTKGAVAGDAVRQAEMLYFGSGNRLIAPDANDSPSAAWDTQSINALVMTLSKAEKPLTDAPQTDSFFTEDSPFLAATLGEMLKRDVSFACGVLPPPKLDLKQRYYATTAANPLMITVPITTEPSSHEAEATGAVLYGMGAEAEPITTAYLQRLSDHMQMGAKGMESLRGVCDAVKWDLGAGAMEGSGILSMVHQILFPCDMRAFLVVAERMNTDLEDYRLRLQKITK